MFDNISLERCISHISLERCYFLFIIFSFPLLSSWLLELVSSILRKTCLICNNFLHKTNNLMVYVQRKGHSQLWVPIEKLPDGGSKLSGKRGGSFLIQTQTQERVPLWKTIFSTPQVSVSGLKIRWQPPSPPPPLETPLMTNGTKQ